MRPPSFINNIKKGWTMKTKYAFLSMILTVLLALPAFGQYGTTNDDDSLRSGTTSKRGMSMMGKPVYESTVQGTHLKVWVMSREEHNNWMKSKSDRDSSGMDRLGTDRMGTDRTGTDRMGTDRTTGTDRMGTESRTGSDTGSTGSYGRMGTESRTGTDTGSTGGYNRMGTDNRTNTDHMGTDRTGTGTYNKSGSSTMGTGTHHVMVEATDASSNQPVRDITGTLQVTSPSMKTTSADLKEMGNHYGADVNLDEQGQYQFTLNLTVDGTSKTAQFEYTPTKTKSMMNR